MMSRIKESKEHEAPSIGNWQLEVDALLQRHKTFISDFFSKCSSDESRVKSILEKKILGEISWLRFYFGNCGKSHLKSTERSQKLRQEGNSLFQKKEYLKATELFTQAILHSPITSDELCLAYGNRSAALFYIEKYEECITDIELAHHNGYPAGSLYKLEVRKIKCLVKLGQYGKAKIDAQRLSSQIQTNADLEEKRKDVVLDDLANCMARINLSSKLNTREDNFESSDIPGVSYRNNDTIVQASSALQLAYSEEKGRHLIATQHIMAGDTLIVERPYAAVLLPDHYVEHCHHCYKRLHSVVPCRRCSRVRYCSDKCSNESWEVYHSIECPYLDILHSVGIAHLSLRIVLTAGLEFLQAFKEDYIKLKRTTSAIDTESLPGISCTGRYERSYLTVYNLMPHSNNMDSRDLFSYAVTAVLLLQILRDSGWFKSEVNLTSDSSTLRPDMCEVTSEGEQYIGSILLRHIQQLVCNAHAITKLQVSMTTMGSVVEDQDQVRVATAIYPTASLMNHSCDPTIIASFNKDILVVRAVKDVQRGEEIFNCYGPHHMRMDREERQQILHDQYFFRCQCKPCTDVQRANNYNCFICSTCSKSLHMTENGDLFCYKCQMQRSLDSVKKQATEGRKLFITALECLEKQNVQEAINVLEKCLDCRQSCLHPHHKDMAETQDCLARCYSIIGDFKRAAKYLTSSIETVKVTFGPKCIEYANELQKYSEILVNAGELQHTLKVIDKALPLFIMHYGPSHESVTDFQKMRAHILQYLESLQ